MGEQGSGPSYKDFPLALRLKGNSRTQILLTSADIRKWLPGDVSMTIRCLFPADMPAGDYELSLAIVDPTTHEPKVKLAIAGMEPDGWYRLGKIRIQH